MEQMCVVCHDRPAAFRCIRCHKPVCDVCAFKDENGAFCSRECSASYRSYRQAQARTAVAARRRGGLLKLVIVLLIVAAAAYAAWKLGLLPTSVTDRLPAGGQQQQEAPEGQEGGAAQQ